MVVFQKINMGAKAYLALAGEILRRQEQGLSRSPQTERAYDAEGNVSACLAAAGTSPLPSSRTG